MGLDVAIYHIVKIHSCDTKKATGDVKYYAHGGIKNGVPFGLCVPDLEFIEESYQYTYTMIVDPVYSCDCDHEEKKITSIRSGYISWFQESEGIKPGELVEYSFCDGFYYGAYSKWSRDCKTGKVKLFDEKMSDCSGFYVGGFVATLRDQLNGVDSESLTEKQLEYREMLEDISDESIKRTLIVHQ